MSSDDGYIIQNNFAGEYVLDWYQLSVGMPNPNQARPEQIYQTLEKAVLAYNDRDKGEYSTEYGLTIRLTKKESGEK